MLEKRNKKVVIKFGLQHRSQNIDEWYQKIETQISLKDILPL